MNEKINLKNCITINLNDYINVNNNNIEKKINNDNNNNNNDILSANHFNNKINILFTNNIFYLSIKENLNQPIYFFNQHTFNYKLNINIDNNIKATIIEHKYHQNNTTEIIAKNNSEIDYYYLQEQDDSNLIIKQHTCSNCNLKLLATNSNNKLNLNIELIGANAKIELNMLQKISHNYTHTINLLINHLNVYTCSNTISRIIAAQQAKCTFLGKIIVTPAGNHTVANLQSKGLIIDQHAAINNHPELMIDNNEVMCSHGASVGNLDQQMLFYLQTRGIGIENATLMLIQAFAQPILQTIKFTEILAYLINNNNYYY